MFSKHLEYLKDQLSKRYTIHTLGNWIQENTYIGGKNFTFKGHEYQLDIISDPAKTVLVNKAAQTGLSEIFARWALAVSCTQRNFTTIWTFPSATDASNFTKARLSPVIASSPEIQRMISTTVDSTELKQFGLDTFLYIRGTISETAGLSVPADILIHDELDRSDVANVSAYVSRLQHKPTKVRRLFSTPTVAGYGIDLECRTAKRKRQMWKCSHCNEHFLPDYERNIVIPGFDGNKREINRYNIKGIRWSEAKLLCPNCGKEPDTSVKYREWVTENPHEDYETVAYYVSPFCAPTIITPPYLVKVSTDFNKWSEFSNQALGLVADDDQEMLVVSDIQGAKIDGDFQGSDLHVLGVDMGLTCHFVVGKAAGDGFIAVHREKCAYTQFEVVRARLCREWRVVVSIHDMFPYTDLITRVVDFDPNAYGAIYVNRLSSETHTIKDQEANATEGKLNVRAVHINREIALDALMYAIKQKRVLINNVDDELIMHMLDMKRVPKFDKHGGIYYKWEKTNGVDHWHHAMLYCYIATKVRSMSSWVSIGQVPLVTSVRLPATHP